MPSELLGQHKGRTDHGREDERARNGKANFQGRDNAAALFNPETVLVGQKRLLSVAISQQQRAARIISDFGILTRWPE